MFHNHRTVYQSKLKNLLQSTLSATQEVPSEHEEAILGCNGDSAVVQVPQRGCGASSLEGHGPGQSALGVQMEQWLEPMDSEVPANLTFCDSASLEDLGLTWPISYQNRYLPNSQEPIMK